MIGNSALGWTALKHSNLFYPRFDRNDSCEE